ncbi:hypothetical protein RGQ13_06020 [Thalassotalea psychrophila]|uniref:DUF4194 domain-containing protein n=1 Tax=Thalassotalea psychrophila TaxID=3065647 RepID=A0ABY9TXK7_9GAMM|nr:hypothetical protein RGQ13_06020 [Colwelliaceae bacterium SQ149]
MISLKGQVMETLLSGGFICKTSDELAFGFLQNTENFASVEQQLNLMNRTIANANDGEVLFCAYQAIGDDERKVVSSQFREITASLLPLIEWLVLVQEAKGDNSPLSEGKVIRLNELQSIIEDTPAFSEQLTKISRYSLFNSSSSAVDAQLKLIFKRLVDLGYLLKPNPDNQIYLATGKVDYLFEVIRFIDESENLNLAEQAEEAIQQGDLL